LATLSFSQKRNMQTPPHPRSSSRENSSISMSGMRSRSPLRAKGWFSVLSDVSRDIGGDEHKDSQRLDTLFRHHLQTSIATGLRRRLFFQTAGLSNRRQRPHWRDTGRQTTVEWYFPCTLTVRTRQGKPRAFCFVSAIIDGVELNPFL
jgi:hypothetical protein